MTCNYKPLGGRSAGPNRQIRINKVHGGRINDSSTPDGSQQACRQQMELPQVGSGAFLQHVRVAYRNRADQDIHVTRSCPRCVGLQGLFPFWQDLRGAHSDGVPQACMCAGLHNNLWRMSWGPYLHVQLQKVSWGLHLQGLLVSYGRGVGPGGRFGL